MATLAIADKMTRKMKSASTLPAVVEARAGQSGNVSYIVSRRSSASSGRMAIVSRPETNQHGHEDSQCQYGCQSRKLQDTRNDGSILAGRRIVVIAVQEHLVCQGSDLVLRRLDQSQAQVFGRVLDAVIVLSDL